MANQTPSRKTMEGKTAIVTGGSRGIGAGIVEELCHRGAQVFFTWNSVTSTHAAEQLIAKLSEYKPSGVANNVRGGRYDLNDPAAFSSIVQAAMAEWSSLDILVNCAGVNHQTSLDAMSAESFAEIFNVNVQAVIMMTKACLPALSPQQARIINIGSTAARVGVPNYSLYCASKAAVEALTRCWAVELGDRGVTVNTVAPGSTKSGLLDASTEKEDVEREARATPAGRRVGEPEDIALLVAWLASEDSRWITGQCICASGGYRMY